MSNIDTAVAALLGSRVDTLLSIGSRSNAATAQTGTSALTVDTPSPSTSVSLLSNQPQPSAQTVLSAIALTLDAIMRSGGDATPSLLGQWPIWPVVPALDVGSGAPAEGPGAGNPAAGNPVAGNPVAGNPASAGAPAGSSASAPANGAQSTAGVAPAAVSVPVDALAAALRQTVAESGLFYESHLAQWLSGQRSPASLTDEPQNRLVSESAQLPLGWALGDGQGADDEGLASWWRGGTPAQQGGGAAQQADPAGRQGQASAAPMARFAAAMQDFAEGTFGANTQAARDGAQGGHADTSQPAAAQAQTSTQAMAASVHQATVTLVRQQLDLLATGQFRWSGEAWPGARLDWTIEDGVDRWSRGGSQGDAHDGQAPQPWRTRLTLSLPVLGTVDAELTLVGSQLAARVQASPSGATRLAAQGESFRQRLAALGIVLSALSIREIAGSTPPDGATAAHAAQAYARSAAAANAATAGDGEPRRGAGRSADLFDGDVLF